MTTATETPTTEIPEPIPKRSDIDKGIRTVFLDRVAHMGIVLDKVQRGVRRAEGLEKMAVTGNVEDYVSSTKEDADMGVNIGNEYHYHVLQPTPPAPPAPEPTPTTATGTTPPAPITAESPQTGPTTTTSTTVSERVRKVGTAVAPFIVGGALLGTGVGGTMLYHYLTDKPSSVTTITQPSGQFEYRYGIETHERK